MANLIELGKNAKAASVNLQALTDEQINKVLLCSAALIRQNTEYLIKENKIDIEYSKEKGCFSSHESSRDGRSRDRRSR